MIEHKIDGPSAWRRGDLSSEDYRIALSGAALDEIRHAADELRRFPLPIILRRPEEFAVPACRAAMAEVRRILDKGVRFATTAAAPIRGDEGAQEPSGSKPRSRVGLGLDPVGGDASKGLLRQHEYLAPAGNLQNRRAGLWLALG